MGSQAGFNKSSRLCSRVPVDYEPSVKSATVTNSCEEKAVCCEERFVNEKNVLMRNPDPGSGKGMSNRGY